MSSGLKATFNMKVRLKKMAVAAGVTLKAIYLARSSSLCKGVTPVAEMGAVMISTKLRKRLATL